MKLKGHRLEQLKLLDRAAATSRETAIAVAFNRAYRPGTLSRMADEGLVENAYLPVNGDSKRRGSHYWLTAAGAGGA